MSDRHTVSVPDAIVADAVPPPSSPIVGVPSPPDGTFR
jgi:hypothetical protein